MPMFLYFSKESSSLYVHMFVTIRALLQWDLSSSSQECVHVKWFHKNKIVNTDHCNLKSVHMIPWWNVVMSGDA